MTRIEPSRDLPRSSLLDTLQPWGVLTFIRGKAAYSRRGATKCLSPSAMMWSVLSRRGSIPELQPSSSVGLDVIPDNS
jgi:hypothetical protein